MQTFTFDGQPDGVALETLRFEDLGDGRTRLHAQSLVVGWLVNEAVAGRVLAAACSKDEVVSEGLPRPGTTYRPRTS